jgi:hypothetical protein
VLGAIKFYVRNMGHYFSLWFTRGHKVKHLDGSNSWMTILVDNVDRLLARENFEDGAKVCSIFMTLNFQAVFWSFICCRYSAHFLFSRISRLVSSHIITLPFPINSGVISVWNIDGGYFSLISSCQKYRGGHARTLKIGPLDGGPRFLFEQLKGLHSCRRVRWHGRNWGLRE